MGLFWRHLKHQKDKYNALWAVKMSQFVKGSLAGNLHECGNTSLKTILMLSWDDNEWANQCICKFENLPAGSVFQAGELLYIVVYALELKIRNLSIWNMEWTVRSRRLEHYELRYFGGHLEVKVICLSKHWKSYRLKFIKHIWVQKQDNIIKWNKYWWDIDTETTVGNSNW